jgi:hypothetical protein
MHELLHESRHVVAHGLMITGFVAVMMLAVEYVNVLTQGVWYRALSTGRWRQYVLAAVLGAIPGCLGAFVVVSLYAHRRLSLGAVVTAMFSTFGDETFVLLAMAPGTAAWLIPALALLGIPVGFLTDLIHRRKARAGDCCDLPLHGEHAPGACFARGRILTQWASPSPHRAILTVALALFSLGIITGWVGEPEWNWVRVTLLVVSLFGLFISATVSDHFLDEHLWGHVLRRHVPRIFLWTMGALVVMHTLDQFLDVAAFVEQNLWIVLLVAVAIGIVPESGPHLVFITLFAAGKLPLSILVASSIVQDGHGMLPMLAHSRRDFLVVKGINVLAGLIIGAALLAAGL